MTKKIEISIERHDDGTHSMKVDSYGIRDKKELRDLVNLIFELKDEKKYATQL